MQVALFGLLIGLLAVPPSPNFWTLSVAAVLLFVLLVLRVSAGNIGYGTSMSLNGAKVAQVVDVQGPAMTGAVAKISNNDSPAAVNSAPWHEYIPSWVDGGKVTFNCVAKTANRSAIMALLGTNTAIVLTLVDTHTFTGHCIVTGCKPGIPLEETEMLDVECQITGVLVYA